MQDVFEKGQEVVVKLEDKDDRNRISLSMLIPEYEHLNPEKKLHIGLSIVGVVTDVNQHGTFVEIAQGIEGKLFGARLPLIAGVKVEVMITNIQPNKKNPSKKDYALSLIKIV